MKLFTSTLLFLIVIALSACVSEEGSRKHAEKGNMMAPKVGMMPGMMWKAVVYSTDTKKNIELGHFESREECHEATLIHATEHKQDKKGHSAAACVVMKSDS